MSNILYNIIILLIIIIFVLCIIGSYSKYTNINKNDSEMVEYDVLTSLKGKSKDMNLCLPGCMRGACNKSKNLLNNCKYDFQCQYCTDKKTKMFYVDFNNEREILPLYEEEKKLTYSQRELLNKSIEKNNKYINLLNHKIELLNS